MQLQELQRQCWCKIPFEVVDFLPSDIPANNSLKVNDSVTRVTKVVFVYMIQVQGCPLN